MAIPLNWTAVEVAILSPADPRSAVYIAIALAILIAVVAALRRRLGAAAMLLGAAWLAAHTDRLSALLGITVVVVGAAVLDEALRSHRATAAVVERSYRATAQVIAAMFVAILAFARLTADADPVEPLFAAGLSPWVPERAIAFIEREGLPAQVFSTQFGTYFAWRLFPKYLNSYDSRTIPFVGLDGVARVSDGVNTLLAPLGPASRFPLRQFCDSDDFPAVYLDETAAVFVRRRPENEEMIARLQIRCDDVKLPLESAKADELLAAGLVLQALEHYPEALAAIGKVTEIAPNSTFGHVVAGELYDATGRWAEAEREYRQAAATMPDTANEMALASIARRYGRTADEIDALHRSIDLAWGFRPIQQFGLLSDAELRAGHPDRALAAIDRAIALLPPGASDPRFQVARGAALRAIKEAHRAPLRGGLVTGLRDPLPQ